MNILILKSKPHMLYLKSINAVKTCTLKHMCTLPNIVEYQ